VTAYATCTLGSGGRLLWWGWECRCGSLLARTYRTPDGGLLDTILEERQPVRIRDAEREGVPAFGLPARVRKEQRGA
jgi:hypothetical protein